MQQQKVLIYGTRANPLSFFLTRSLNRRLTAHNVFCVDTMASRKNSRLLPMRDVYNCNELPDLGEGLRLQDFVEENAITDVIDMTNRSCIHRDPESTSGSNIESLPLGVRVFSPVFTTPLDLREHKEMRAQSRAPVMPGMVYPFKLAQYNFPCDLGTYIIWQSYMP